MSRAMVRDGALIFWLDGEENVAYSPNENLGREFMELFTLGVGNYSQSTSTRRRSLHGYNVDQTSGAVTFDPKLHDNDKVSVLGKRQVFDAVTLKRLDRVAPENATFIARRLWFRFISSSIEPPASLSKVFENRDISPLINSIARNPAMRRPQYSQAKSPVEWFVSACRALRVTPSKLPSSGAVSWYWIRWVSSPSIHPASAAGLRRGVADGGGDAVPHQSRLLPRSERSYRCAHLVPKSKMVQAAADWLGVAQWSVRTERSLNQAVSDSARLALLALNAPEYL